MNSGKKKQNKKKQNSEVNVKPWFSGYKNRQPANFISRQQKLVYFLKTTTAAKKENSKYCVTGAGSYPRCRSGPIRSHGEQRQEFRLSAGGTRTFIRPSKPPETLWTWPRLRDRPFNSSLLSAFTPLSREEGENGKWTKDSKHSVFLAYIRETVCQSSECLFLTHFYKLMISAWRQFTNSCTVVTSF